MHTFLTSICCRKLVSLLLSNAWEARRKEKYQVVDSAWKNKSLFGLKCHLKLLFRNPETSYFQHYT